MGSSLSLPAGPHRQRLEYVGSGQMPHGNTFALYEVEVRLRNPPKFARRIPPRVVVGDKVICSLRQIICGRKQQFRTLGAFRLSSQSSFFGAAFQGKLQFAQRFNPSFECRSRYFERLEKAISALAPCPPASAPGKAISIWMSVAERAEYRRICALANRSRSGPMLSRSLSYVLC